MFLLNMHLNGIH